MKTTLLTIVAVIVLSSNVSAVEYSTQVGQMDWFTATDYCDALGQRLPSIAELESVQAVYKDYGMTGHYLWTNERYDATRAWAMGMFYNTTAHYDAYGSTPYVVCVSDEAIVTSFTIPFDMSLKVESVSGPAEIDLYKNGEFIVGFNSALISEIPVGNMIAGDIIEVAVNGIKAEVISVEELDAAPWFRATVAGDVTVTLIDPPAPVTETVTEYVYVDVPVETIVYQNVPVYIPVPCELEHEDDDDHDRGHGNDDEDDDDHDRGHGNDDDHEDDDNRGKKYNKKHNKR